MNNTPKTVEEILHDIGYVTIENGGQTVTVWQQYAKPEKIEQAITALNELIRNERIDELEIQPLFSDKVEQAEYENNRIAELRAEERLQK